MNKQNNGSSLGDLKRKSAVRVINTAILLLFLVAASVVLAQSMPPQALEAPPLSSSVNEIEKWKRFEVAYGNSTWSGNPFDLEFEATFRHVPSGRELTQFGFYAGNNSWKLYFMPDEVGQWTYVTQSPDPELNGHSGWFTAVASKLPGQLSPEGNRWRLEGSGEHVAPIMLPIGPWFKRTNTNDGIHNFIDWAGGTAGALIIGTTLVYCTLAQDEVTYLKGQEGELFNISMWDRLNSHYDALRDRGMGFYIMFYADDEDSPNRCGIPAQSAAEERLMRYAIARFSAYPIVMWDTGIDIEEYRSLDWVEWYAEWINTNDPWQHPVSSRTGGGSGGKFPEEATYYSDGTKELPSHEVVVGSWQSRAVPTAYTDRWRENYDRGDFDRDKIRQAAWEVGLVGGTGIYLGGNENSGYLGETYATDLEAAPDLGHRTKFFCQHIRNLSQLVPHDELITSGANVILSADPGQEYVAYSRTGGSIGINLSTTAGVFNVAWYNPLTGQLLGQTTTTGGDNRTLVAPFTGEAVLHLYTASTGNRQLLALDQFIYLPFVFTPSNPSNPCT